MLALLTLNKLVKLEFLALAEYWANAPTDVKTFVGYDADSHLVASERAFYRHFFTSCQFAINSEDLCFTYTCLDAIFRNEGITDIIPSIFDDSFPSYTQYYSAPNPNRFIKSSFALSLLWVAKFYRSLSDRYTAFSKHEIKAFMSYAEVFRLLNRLLGLGDGLFFEYQLPNTFNWVKRP